MRQKSRARRARSGGPNLRLDACASARLLRRGRSSARQAPAQRGLWLTGASADRAQRRRAPMVATTRPLTRAPPPCPLARCLQLFATRLGRSLQHDLRAPPPAGVVALGLVGDQTRGLQVVQPALHALAVRAHKPPSLSASGRDLTPAHHRRQPHNQLLDRARKPARARRVPQPEQVPLDHIHTGVDPVIARRDAAACPARTSKQRTDDEPAGLGRKRRPSRAVPTPLRRRAAAMPVWVLQRHRQRPKAPDARDNQRRRADARGAAGQAVRSRA